MWAAGSPCRTWSRLGPAQGRAGRIETGTDLRVHGQDRVFAAGDIGLVTGHPAPQLSQPAIQEGRCGPAGHPARGRQPTEAFQDHDKGQRPHRPPLGVVELPWALRFPGTLAWLGWLGLHLFSLLGGRNRVATLINLGWRYVSWRHGGSVIVGDEPSGQPRARGLPPRSGAR